MQKTIAPLNSAFVHFIGPEGVWKLVWGAVVGSAEDFICKPRISFYAAELAAVVFNDTVASAYENNGAFSYKDQKFHLEKINPGEVAEMCIIVVPLLANKANKLLAMEAAQEISTYVENKKGLDSLVKRIKSKWSWKSFCRIYVFE
jgi:hypothetical protein